MISQRAAATGARGSRNGSRSMSSDGFIGWLPLYHCGGDESLYATMHTGGVFCALRKADAETMYRVIARDRLTWTLLLPGVLTDFLNHPRRRDHDLDEPALRDRLRQHDARHRRGIDGRPFDRLLRRLRAERIVLSARPWRLRARRDAVLWQAALRR